MKLIIYYVIKMKYNREISLNMTSSKSYLSPVVSYYYQIWVLVVLVWMKRKNLFKLFDLLTLHS